MLRSAILWASRNPRVKDVVAKTPGLRGVVSRFVAGESSDDAVAVTRRLVADGLAVSLDHLGEDTTDVGMAERTTKAYLALLARLAEEGLAQGIDVSLKLSAVGQALDERLASENARAICDAAKAVRATVTLDMEDHTTTDSTLRVLGELRRDFPETGAVIQAYLRRSEADCRDLAYPGSRVRLCKGAYDEPDSVAFASKREVDRSYVRCLRTLMAGPGYPMVASHDPRLISIAAALAERTDRPPGSYEYQMLYGVRPGEQLRLARAGQRMRVYVPYGDQWYAYLMRRLAERPANLAFFLKGALTRG
jgi:proline dehydrogenase